MIFTHVNQLKHLFKSMLCFYADHYCNQCLTNCFLGGIITHVNSIVYNVLILAQNAHNSLSICLLRSHKWESAWEAMFLYFLFHLIYIFLFEFLVHAKFLLQFFTDLALRQSELIFWYDFILA